MSATVGKDGSDALDGMAPTTTDYQCTYQSEPLLRHRPEPLADCCWFTCHTGPCFGRHLSARLELDRSCATCLIMNARRESIAESVAETLQEVSRPNHDRLVFLSAIMNSNAVTHAGKMIVAIFAGRAEFEHDSIRERTSAGRDATKHRGAHLNWPRALNSDQLQNVSQLLSGHKPVRDIAKTFNVHEASVYRLALVSWI